MIASTGKLASLDGVEACVFDAYGTLFNVHAAAQRLRDEIGPEADRMSMIWRTKQLEYTWLRSLMRAYKPFWEVTQDGLDYAMEATGLGDRPDLRQKLLDIYFRLDAYPEVPEMLSRLRAGGLKTAILSNGSKDMLDGAVSSAGLSDILDSVQSVEDVGIFKPDPSVYQMSVDDLDLDARDKICFMSSNAWDAAAAADFGFRVVWVNRFRQPRERLPGEPKAVLETLEPLPDLLGC